MNDTSIINKTSFHYKFNKFMKTKIGNTPDWLFDERLPKDFCSYWRMTLLNSVLGLLLFTTGAFIASAFVAGFISDPLGVIGVFAVILAMVAIPAGLFVGGYYLREYIKTRAAIREDYNKAHNIPDGIIKTKYKSWKHKFCPKVEYK